jgi:hypothetical protein
VFGSRKWTDRETIASTLNAYLETGTVVVHGDCRSGADRIANDICVAKGVPVEAHPAKWDLHGRAAGPIRNEGMAASGIDLALGFGDGAGTRDMHERCVAHGIPVVMTP